MPVTLIESLSWLKRTLQDNLFPHLDECWKTPLTDREKQLVSIRIRSAGDAFTPRAAGHEAFPVVSAKGLTTGYGFGVCRIVPV
jgi:hypothetical protein